MSDDMPVGTGKPARNRTLLAVLVLVVALGVFVAAFAYAGGVEYVTDLLAPKNVSPATAAKPLVPATQTSPVDTEFAKRLYVEQIESAAVLDRMAQGQVGSFNIKSVKTQGDGATIDVSVGFVDGTTASGVIALAKSNGSWFLLSIGGMRGASTNGLADSVSPATGIEASDTIEAHMQRAGIGSFDGGILQTLISQQAANQKLVTAILAGTYTTVEFAPVQAGAGTVQIPVSLTGAGGANASGSILLVKKTIDGANRTFLTAIKEQ